MVVGRVLINSWAFVVRDGGEAAGVPATPDQGTALSGLRTPLAPIRCVGFNGRVGNQKKQHHPKKNHSRMSASIEFLGETHDDGLKRVTSFTLVMLVATLSWTPCDDASTMDLGNHSADVTTG